MIESSQFGPCNCPVCRNERGEMMSDDDVAYLTDVGATVPMERRVSTDCIITQEVLDNAVTSLVHDQLGRAMPPIENVSTEGIPEMEMNPGAIIGIRRYTIVGEDDCLEDSPF